MPFAATWMQLEIIIQLPYGITQMWNVKYDTHEPIYETNRVRDIEINLWLPSRVGVGRDGVGLWDQQMQTGIYKMD